MTSYAALRKKAGLPPPTGLAEFSIPKPRRRPRFSEAAKKEMLRLELAKMVAAGEIAMTPDGRYYLP